MDNGVKVETNWFTVQGPGMFIVVVLMVAAIIYSMMATQESLRLTQVEHQEIVRELKEVTVGLNDVFISTVLTPDQKRGNLPRGVEEKLQEKLAEKAKEKASQP